MSDWITPGGTVTEAHAARANRAVDYLISGAIYVPDDDGAPAYTAQRDACTAAAALIAEHFATGADMAGDVSLGSLRISATSESSTAAGTPWGDAVRILRGAGLGWVIR